jgi:hypothetical protein
VPQPDHLSGFKDEGRLAVSAGGHLPLADVQPALVGSLGIREQPDKERVVGGAVQDAPYGGRAARGYRGAYGQPVLQPVGAYAGVA